MTIKLDPNRRRFLEQAIATAALSPLAVFATPAISFTAGEITAIGFESGAGGAATLPNLLPLKYVNAGVLNVAYYEAGPKDGPVAMLLHGFPYDIHSYIDVAPMLATRGMRVIVPYLRGYGPTRFLDAGTMRSGEQAALGADLIALMDALGIERAVVAGYDWGGRAACVAAALFPERCTGLVCVNSYLIQDIAAAQKPVPPKSEVPLWYQYYFHQERGRAGLRMYRREIARILWSQWSPNWKFSEETFERTAASFDCADFVDIVIHSYRHRFGLVRGDERYAHLQRRLSRQPAITVPAITLDGSGDGVVAANDGTPTAARFTASRQHRIIPDVGHNLPQEAPDAFAAAVAEISGA